MPQNSTQLSFRLNLPSHAISFLTALNNRLETMAGASMPCILAGQNSPGAELTEDDEAVVADIYRVFNTTSGCMIGDGHDETLVYSDESASVQVLASLISHTLERHAPDATVAFEWAEVCSKPVPGEFGGGAAIVTATGTRWLDTAKWLEEQMAAPAVSTAA